MYEHVRYDLLADADAAESVPIESEPRSNKSTEEEEQAFSFDSAFDYDAGAVDDKYRTDANYNSAFKYSDNGRPEGHPSPSVALNMSYGEKFTIEGSERSITSCATMITRWIFTFLSYIFFVITSPIT
jgi:hypothetical protein